MLFIYYKKPMIIFHLIIYKNLSYVYYFFKSGYSLFSFVLLLSTSPQKQLEKPF